MVKNKTFFNHNHYASSGVFWQTKDVSEEKASLKLFGQIANEYHHDRTVIIEHRLMDTNGVAVYENQQSLVAKTGLITSFEVTTSIKTPKLWSPEDPYLYRLESKIINSEDGSVLDVVSNPLGFRSLKLDNEKGLFLNGKSIKLKGAARHQDFDGIGSALPDPLHKRDMQLLKESGANFVRISHYPQDPAIYNACDQLGLLSWSEIPTVSWVPYGSPFFSNSVQMMKEMIYQNFNHPSVIIWGYHNEVWTVNEEAIAHARILENTTRDIDPDRLTAMAFHGVLYENYFTSDLDKEMFDVAMINGFNLYTGWYWGKLSEVGEKLETLRGFSPNKPIMFSEYGAGSDPRIHTYKPTVHDFSQEYQIDYQIPYLEEGNKHDWMIGFAYWNFIDFQRDGRGDAVPNMNSKGMVTTDRKPKDLYYFYQSQWSDKPMVHIAQQWWTKRIELTNKTSVKRKVRIFSNQPKVSLVHNGQALGVKELDNGVVEFEVEFVNGENILQASIPETLLTDILEVDYQLVSQISKNGLPQEGLNLNVGQSRTHFTDDKSKEVWIPCPKYKKGSIGYVDGVIYHMPYEKKPALRGVREGKARNFANTHIDPVFQTFMEDIKQFKADVPDGLYRVTILTSEPFYENSKNYTPEEIAWGVVKDAAQITEREMTVKINGAEAIVKLNPAQQAGANYPFQIEMEVIAENNKGITLDFIPVNGKTLLSGVKVKPLN